MIDSLNDDQILEMYNVGLIVPTLLINRLKNNSATPLKTMLITSSSQYTPRKLEPVYSACKAGLGMLGASLQFDSELGKVLVIAPSGMNTTFWKIDSKPDFLNPSWVAEQIRDVSGGPFKYRYVTITRNPEKVTIVEELVY